VSLLAPDPALPRRDALLDPDVLVPALTARLRTGAVSGCQVLRVKYRLGESIRVLLALDTRRGSQRVTVRGFPPGAGQAAYESAMSRAVTGTQPVAVAFDPGLEAVLWTFPNDRRLNGLERLLAQAPPGLGESWARSQLAAYAPEKAATVRALDAGGKVIGYAKLYVGDGALRTHAFHEALAGADGLRTPRSLGLDADARILVVEAMDGRPLAAIRDGQLIAGVHALGRALAALHSVPLLDAPSFERLEVSRLLKAAELIGRAQPAASAAARRLADLLATRSGDAEGEARLLHGDVHPGNAIVSGDSLALVDLDAVSLGPAAADLGSFLAYLRYARITGKLPAALERGLAGALLDGYGTRRPVPGSEAIAWHTAAALLGERALRAVNRVRADGLAHLPALVDDARTVLAA
jgi:aminoglycoside phosphotransferase